MKELIGNLPIQQTLQKMAASKRIPPVLLFSGPSGVGKRTFARTFIDELFISQKIDHPDIKEYAPENVSETYSVAQIDQFIEEVSLSPFEESYRFFLFHDAHRLMSVHANRLLKTLEEMPDHAVVILFAPDSRQLLDTVVSRSVTLNFFPISEDELSQKVDPQVAKWAEGSLTKALEHEQNSELIELSLKSLEAYFQNQLDIGNEQLEKMQALFEQKEKSKWGQFSTVLDVIMRWMRDVQASQVAQSEHLYYPEKGPLFKRIASKKIIPLEKVKSYQQEAIDGFRKNIKPKTIIQQHLLQLSLRADL